MRCDSFNGFFILRTSKKGTRYKDTSEDYINPEIDYFLFIKFFNQKISFLFSQIIFLNHKNFIIKRKLSSDIHAEAFTPVETLYSRLK